LLDAVNNPKPKEENLHFSFSRDASQENQRCVAFFEQRMEAEISMRGQFDFRCFPFDWQIFPLHATLGPGSRIFGQEKGHTTPMDFEYTNLTDGHTRRLVERGQWNGTTPLNG
jgi:hypothetical protein